MVWPAKHKIYQNIVTKASSVPEIGICHTPPTYLFLIVTGSLSRHLISKAGFFMDPTLLVFVADVWFMEDDRFRDQTFLYVKMSTLCDSILLCICKLNIVMDG